MPLFSFGQPEGGIIQTAFVTDDIRRSMADMTRLLGIGPWFLFEDFQIDELQHRGAPADFHITLALGNSGHMQYELIQPLDQQPSVYRETVEQRGWGFHHHGIGARDFDAACEGYRAAGFEMALYGVVAVGARAAYFDTSSPAGGMIEVIEMTSVVEELWNTIRLAAATWDGTEPVRTLP